MCTIVSENILNFKMFLNYASLERSLTWRSMSLKFSRQKSIAQSPSHHPPEVNIDLCRLLL